MTALNVDFKEPENLETYIIKDGLKVVEHFFDLPLDWSNPGGSKKIKVFARQCIPTDKARTPEDQAKLPIVLYLQGGPGFEVPLVKQGGFGGELYKAGYQVLWLDQRGTGLSTPLSADTLPSDVKTAQEIANYTKFFRADSIVKDCEAIRRTLLGSRENEADRKWTTLGQSYGGFLTLTYLSFHPEGLKESWLTGGLAPVALKEPGLVYQKLMPGLVKRNEIYYRKYPQDVARVRKIVSYLETNKVITPNGSTLSLARFQLLGMDLGRQGGIDDVHQIVFRAAHELATLGKLSYKMIQTIEQANSTDGNPIYAILQEPAYTQGAAARWAGKRAIQSHPQFSWDHVKSLSEDQPLYFIGEMMIPEIFDDFAALRPFKEAVEILAEDDSWAPLYDLDQLAKNEVKATAVTYTEDLFVDFELAQDTARRVKGLEQYITNQLYHDGLRANPVDVLGKLWELSRREYD
ncbi:alpha/beta-hydrolase [Coprinellus micaceus]|uniref:Alpha/beta-hydrolase n=1 Tax=Coprinellus micaceus TaxID=71717 RepID=A0A4Y7TWU9_COPMI|nr:alpha/beta-hydrolase [Coprinellus micaceus]